MQQHKKLMCLVEKSWGAKQTACGSLEDARNRANSMADVLQVHDM